MSAVPKEIKKSEFYQHRFPLAETARNIFQATVEPDISREDLLEPEFWKHVSKSLRPYSRIEVVTDDGRFFAELLVLNAGDNWASVQELRYIELGLTDAIKQASAMDKFEVNWKGPHRKFAVSRKSDNEVIKDRMETKEEAFRFLSEHVKVIGK